MSGKLVPEGFKQETVIHKDFERHGFHLSAYKLQGQALRPSTSAETRKEE